MVNKKNGADFTMTSEHSEHLPLPHTKGTKPAPLLLKSIGYNIMSQEKN
tara:strand:+ start:102 stop:248 length:147 start_codon:yes stop_codon:yes gene_type:complete